MSLNSQESESGLERLLQRAASGSDSGLGELLESFRASMLAFAGRRIDGQLRRRISSSDVVQDTMLTAREKFTSFRGTHPLEFQQWLHRLLYSTLVDGVRRHRTAEKRRTDREDEASVGTIVGSAASPSRVASDNEQAARLLQALQQLPEEDRRIVQLRYLENWSFEQIATTLGVSVATAWRRFQQATERVHRSLRQTEDER
jgi:RNA polymerase sigma-70 factor (ECF subfamily)